MVTKRNVKTREVKTFTRPGQKLETEEEAVARTRAEAAAALATLAPVRDQSRIQMARERLDSIQAREGPPDDPEQLRAWCSAVQGDLSDLARITGKLMELLVHIYKDA